ncbi:hypothetical protein GCM10027598_27310 [Amycolatopsis oliviviridis]|uniref:DNA-binding protein n=1 Tax=Amycolatopsis oliviviridis TaxID=1471590 RepID=A0ABQ3LKL2_9PSEU|nr:hypothetical protein [Amycolatopsis oliviviridis]GHH17711.1 hypothetical protein GCM10017790_34960 [Amycolatopsis oliviviridis]
MGQYELIFSIDRLEEEHAFEISNTIDVMYSEHGRTSLLTVTSEGDTALTAATDVVAQLETQFGVIIHRAYEDLVTKADIAGRAGATVQAVGQWVRGVRRKELPFPEPFNLVSGGVWLWADVNEWLREAGKTYDDEVLHPNHDDLELINAWLRTRTSSQPSRRINLIRLGSATSEQNGVQFTASAQSTRGVHASAVRAPDVVWTRADYEMAG